MGNAVSSHQPQHPTNHRSAISSHQTYAVVGVELRRHNPFIGSIRNAHEHVPLSWNFHLFHMNFSTSPQSHGWWLPNGKMGQTIREFKQAGRRVYTHVYPDAWHSERVARKIDRTGNLYPRKAEFWSTMTEDRVMTVEADTAFCGATRFTQETFSRFPYLGAPTHVRPPSYSADNLNPVLNGGFSLRSRRAMLECIEWAQRKVRGHSVKLLWDKSVYRNEDLMYSKCLIQAEMRLRYPFPKAETAWHFSCEHGCYHRMTRGAPVPWGIHDLCRDLIQYGGCSARDELVNSAGVANYITGGVNCTREGFNLPEAFSAFERYCGSDLQYMAYKCLKLNVSSGAAIDEARIIHMGAPAARKRQPEGDSRLAVMNRREQNGSTAHGTWRLPQQRSGLTHQERGLQLTGKSPDCRTVVPKPLDQVPIRSPQALHTALLPFITGRDVVEIGTRKGDGMSCFASVAKSAVAVEMDRKACAALERRAIKMRSSGGSAFSVICSDYRQAKSLDADVFTWWQQDPFLRNFAVLRALRKQLDLGRVRATAKAIFAIDPKYGPDIYDLAALRRANWWKTNLTIDVPFDDKEACLQAKQVKTLRCDRAQGRFVLVVVPLAEVPTHLTSRFF